MQIAAGILVRRASEEFSAHVEDYMMCHLQRRQEKDEAKRGLIKIPEKGPILTIYEDMDFPRLMPVSGAYFDQPYLLYQMLRICQSYEEAILDV